MGSPTRDQRLNGWLVIFWLANIPPVVALYLLVDNATFQRIILLYITLVSIWANTASHWAAWIAARVEVRQHEDQQD